jgi:flavin reductase (DIM6/NTAB) family NADH-FMN oxidoreductase RutF
MAVPDVADHGLHRRCDQVTPGPPPQESPGQAVGPDEFRRIQGSPDQAVGSDEFRRILAHAPSSVVVVTGSGADGPAGLSVGSFVSVSLDPPLIGFFVGKTSSSWPTVRATGRFCVNVLAADQTEVSRRFAVKGGDKFADIAWSYGTAGLPVIDNCVAWIGCRLEREIETGDHVLVLGRVLDLKMARDAHALIFHRGSYTSTGGFPPI